MDNWKRIKIKGFPLLFVMITLACIVTQTDTQTPTANIISPTADAIPPTANTIPPTADTVPPTPTKLFTPEATGNHHQTIPPTEYFITGDSTTGDFTIIHMSDTQKYTRRKPQIFAAQTQWIAENRDKLNIVYVAHSGDIVSRAEKMKDWHIVDDALRLLEDPLTTGLPDGIPYGLAPGNHDYPTGLYNDFFGLSRFQGRSYFGGAYPGEGIENNYVLFNAGGMDFLVFNFEYQERPDDLLSWADDVLKNYPDHRVIVVSHYLLLENSKHTRWGREVYKHFKDNPNLFLMLTGHRHAQKQRSDLRNENPVYTLLADYTSEPDGGSGYLRILNFSPANDEIRVWTYSPWLDQYLTDEDNQFVLSYDMTPGDPP